MGLLGGGSGWFCAGYECFLGGYQWLSVVTGGYGLVTGGYRWVWGCQGVDLGGFVLVMSVSWVVIAMFYSRLAQH